MNILWYIYFVIGGFFSLLIAGYIVFGYMGNNVDIIEFLLGINLYILFIMSLFIGFIGVIAERQQNLLVMDE